MITIMLIFSPNASHASYGTGPFPLSNAFNAWCIYSSIQITTCECRYHGYSGYFAVTMVSLERTYKAYLILFCRVHVCASCAKGSGLSWCLHGFTAFTRDHPFEPIHLQRVWTLQRFADYRPYGILGAFFHLSFLCTVLRDTCICQTYAK